jgi:HEPN domain-containing protein
LSLAQFEEAQLLLRKAREDADAVAKLAPDGNTADAIVGFHAQQAVEKALKAVLAAFGEDFPWTHDLRYLIERLGDLETPPPSSLHEVRVLAPWAVEFRYGETIDDPLDREQAGELVTETIAWAEAQIWREPSGQTQPIRASDHDDGVVRIPQAGKRLLPTEACQIKVVLRGLDLGEVRWEPRDPERSGRIGVGKRAAARIAEGDVLLITLLEDVVRLD